jgi:hypothetical protein
MKHASMAVKKLGVMALAFSCAGLLMASANMLQNASFETASTTGENAAQNWKMGDPDEHGDAWGSATRENWRAHEGVWMGAIRGTWSAAGDFGGWWQEIAATPGSTYHASAQLWADGSWKADVQEMKIEFWNGDRSTMLSAVTNALTDIGEVWVEKTLDGTAPEGAAWARVVINASGIGAEGALQIDEVDLDLAI